jgi:RNA polymerase subunit RPABC4/transcription elongation factor Spt4
MLIIMYEMTMLAGVIATVIGIIFESRLPNMKPGIYDTRITEGWIGVVITFDDESKVADAESVLNKAGALEIKHA